MKTFGTFLMISFLLLFACKAKKDLSLVETDAVKSELVEIENPLKSFTMGSLDNIAKEDLLYSLKEVKIADKKIAVQVQYGGGCVKPHLFELITDGVIDQSGNMNFYLLHKTHNDRCKALMIEDLVFDLENLYKLQSDVLKTIRLNNMRKIDLN